MFETHEKLVGEGTTSYKDIRSLSVVQIAFQASCCFTEKEGA